MNLGELRNAIFAQSDWAPKQSVEAKTRLNEFINRAYQQLALEAPFLFFQSELEFATQTQVVSKDDVTDSTGAIVWDRVVCVDDLTDNYTAGNTTLRYEDETEADPEKFTGNPWVWRLNLIGTQAEWNVFADQGGVIPETDGSWDGRPIDIQLEEVLPHKNQEGKTIWFKNRIRTIWKVVTGDEPNPEIEYHFTLWNPVPIERYKTDPADPPPEPWNTGPFRYRIYTDRYYLPDDFIQAEDFVCLGKASADDTPRRNLIEVMFQYTADSYALDDQFRTIKGRPYKAFRREHFQIPAPNTAPLTSLWELPVETVAGEEVYIWQGPEPAGTFSYIVTYTWGKRDYHFRLAGPGAFDENYTQNPDSQWIDEVGFATTKPGGEAGVAKAGAEWVTSAARCREPLWESAPSPQSEKITVRNAQLEPIADPRFPAILLRLPNIEFMLGMIGEGTFWDSTGGGSTEPFKRSFAGQSGFKVRIYRRRHTADFAKYQHLSAVDIQGATYSSMAFTDNAGTPGLVDYPHGHIEVSDAYYLLAEVDTKAATRGFFIDDGQIHPDYSRRLRDTHGYQSMALYPIPDDRYVIRVNCIRRPERLIDDADVPYIHAEACDILVSKSMEMWYEMNGNAAGASTVRARYKEELFTLAKRYGDLKPQAQGMRRSPIRAVPRGYWQRRWYSTEDKNIELFPVIP